MFSYIPELFTVSLKEFLSPNCMLWFHLGIFKKLQFLYLPLYKASNWPFSVGKKSPFLAEVYNVKIHLEWKNWRKWEWLGIFREKRKKKINRRRRRKKIKKEEETEEEEEEEEETVTALYLEY